MHTTFVDASGRAILVPGDDLLDLMHKPPLGPCSTTIHLMGYWYDRTKQGALLYLTDVVRHNASPSESMPLPESIAPIPPCVSTSPSAAITRVAAIREEAEQLKRNPSPPAPGSSGSPILRSPLRSPTLRSPRSSSSSLLSDLPPTTASDEDGELRGDRTTPPVTPRGSPYAGMGRRRFGRSRVSDIFDNLSHRSATSDSPGRARRALCVTLSSDDSNTEC